MPAAIYSTPYAALPKAHDAIVDRRVENSEILLLGGDSSQPSFAHKSRKAVSVSGVKFSVVAQTTALAEIPSARARCKLCTTVS